MQVKKINIGSGDSAIYETLYNMKRLARRDASSDVIVNIAKQIKLQCANDDVCIAKKAFDFVYDNVKYEYDKNLVVKYIKTKDPESVEFFAAPKFLLGELFEGDCDDMSTALASLYIALGLPVNFKIIAWKSNAFSHVYTEVGLQNIEQGAVWIPSDPVIKVFGIEKAPVIRAYVIRVDSDDNEIVKLINK